MTSPLALTVEEVSVLAAEAGGEITQDRRFACGAIYLPDLCEKANALIESKRQSYMSTDRARAEYDPDGWRGVGG